MLRMLRLPRLVTNRAKNPLQSAFLPPQGLLENQDCSKPPTLPCRSTVSEEMLRMLRIPRFGTNITMLPLCSAFATPCLQIHSSSEPPTNKKKMMALEVRKIRKEIDPDYNLKSEAKKLLKDIEFTMKEVEESEFYGKLSKQLKSAKFRGHLRRVLGSYTHLQIVIYTLGSMEFSYSSQYQVAIALLLKKDFSHWVGDIDIFDQQLSPADTIVLEKLGCNVSLVNENCSRQVEKPTLFYMPHARNGHLEYMLQANWNPSQINKVILLATRISAILKWVTKLPSGSHGIDCMKAISNHTKEIRVYNYYEFTDFAWHFFPVPPDMDMESLVPDECSKERREAMKMASLSRWEDFGLKYLDVMENVEASWEYSPWAELRGPCRYRICANIAYPLNIYFSGKGCDENSPAGFAGALYNNFNQPIVAFCGPFGEVDALAANVEALRRGLVLMKTINPPVKCLRVVGDNLSVIRWVRLRNQAKGCKPPEKVRQGLAAVFGMLKGLKICLVYHIYEEPNSDAIGMAKMGAEYRYTRVWDFHL